MAGLIPRSFIDDLLTQTDIVTLIDSYVPLKKRGASYLCCCPFHNEKTPSFNVVAKKQFYHCFGCGVSGNAISFMMDYLQLNFVEAIESLATKAGMTVPQENDKQPQKEKPSPTLYQLLNDVAAYYQKQLKTSGPDAITYLKQREVSGQIAQLYQIGFAPQGWHHLENHFKHHRKSLIKTGMLIQKEDGSTYDRYRHRIMYPIHDKQGQIIGFGGRVLDNDQKPKYLNSPETIIFQKGRELYGLYQVIQTKQTIDSIMIVEGYMDVIALAQHGIQNCVATLGTATSSSHIQQLGKYTKELIFCFDGDSAGKQAAWRALESCLPHLNKGLAVKFMLLPDKHDPDSLVREIGKAQFLERTQSAMALSDFFFEQLTKDIDHTSLAGKNQLILTAKPYLNKMQEGAYKQLIVDELARLTRIEPHRILQLIQENRPVPQSKLELGNHIQRSPLRIAIAILLQHPELYHECIDTLDSALYLNIKHDVFKGLLKQIEENPQINTATLIEQWRDSALFESITKLAAWDHQVPESALKNEFQDIILFLSKQNQEQTIQQLLNKAKHQGLGNDERIQLQTLLKGKHEKPHTK